MMMIKIIIQLFINLLTIFEMGTTSSNNNLLDNYDTIQVRPDATTLLKHRKTKHEFILRHIASNI